MKHNIIENFVGKEVCDYLNSYMTKNNLLDDKGKCTIYINENSGENAICMGWFPEIPSLMKDLKTKQQDSLIYDLFNLISQSMCNVFDFKKSEIVYETSHYKYFGVDKVGDGFGSEKDGENGQHPHFDHWGDGGRIYTAVLYLNDEYEGGEITFYEDNDESKPIPYKMNSGSLVYFDGYTKHAVENLISGQRASFILHIRHLGED